MRRRALKYTQRLFIDLSLFLLLAFILPACNLGGGNPQATTHNGNPHPTSPGIHFGAQPCPAAAKNPAHWNAIAAQGAGQTVEQVICGNLVGTPELQAAVMIRHGGSDRILDVSVYNHITANSPASFFALHGLLQGEARISGYNTLLTGQVDPHSTVNKGLPASQLARDLFREFQWSDSAGTLVQIAFPGFFPDLTRYQAEMEQEMVNSGQGFQQWRLNVVLSAQTLANTYLNWPPDAPVTVLSGGGSHDYKALVQVHNTAPGGGSVRITFSRLEGNNNGGLWEATAIQSEGMSISSPRNAQRLTSPIIVTGINTAFAGKIMAISVLDHTQTAIGHITFTAAHTSGKFGFSSDVPYTASFQGSIQEGIIALYAYNANSSIAAAVMAKVLLSA